MEQPQGDHLTGPEVGLGMFGDGAQLLIDLVEQRRDQIHCGHGLLRSSQGYTLSTSLEEVYDHDNKPTVCLGVTSAVAYTYGYGDGRIGPTRCAVIVGAPGGPCTWPLRINTSDSPVDRHRDKKAWARGRS